MRLSVCRSGHHCTGNVQFFQKILRCCSVSLTNRFPIDKHTDDVLIVRRTCAIRNIRSQIIKHIFCFVIIRRLRIDPCQNLTDCLIDLCLHVHPLGIRHGKLWCKMEIHQLFPSGILRVSVARYPEQSAVIRHHRNIRLMQDFVV